MNQKNSLNVDAVIIGGSYAGLSAALTLGRALQEVIIIDSRNPCNRQTPHSHNFLTQDGATPASIAAKGLEQVLAYPTIQFVKDTVISAQGTDNDFRVYTASGDLIYAKKLIFTTGVKDIMPDIRGFADCWGISVIHCPYCHGYEFKGENTGLMINGDEGADHAVFINNWAGKLTVFTQGASTISAEKMDLLSRHSIQVVETEIVGIEHNEGDLEKLVLADQQEFPLDALYAALPFVQHSDIPEKMGCSFSEAGYIEVDDFKKTSVPGVFAAGDNTTRMRTVSGAVFAGTMAGVMSSRELITEKSI